MNLKIQLPKLNRSKKEITPRTIINLFRNQEHSNDYRQKVIEKVNNEEKVYERNEEKPSNVVNTCLEAGREVLGEKIKNTKPPENKEIKILTDIKQSLTNNMKGCSSQEVRCKMKEEYKRIKSKIHTKLKIIEENDLDRNSNR